MSLLGAIVDYYDNGNGSDLTALRSLLGADGMYADVMPGEVSSPYCVLGEVSRTLSAQARATGNRHRIYEATVAFAIFGANRAEAESILDAIDVAYSSEDAQLDISGYTHMATHYVNRVSFYDDSCNMWRGQIELQFKISSPST